MDLTRDPYHNTEVGGQPGLFLRPFALKLHRAKRLHLDLRLCDFWIARSWAMYEMPSYCPRHFSTAIQVEDHLRENIGFEGVHPKGKHGAGPTIVVDHGLWQPLREYCDIDASLREGCLRFELKGKRLRGLWRLVRRDSVGAENPRWNLSKEPDVLAVNEHLPGSLNEAAFISSLTGKTMQEMERDWHEGKRQFRAGGSLFES